MLFGAPSSTGRDARLARRRFTSNSAGAPVQRLFPDCAALDGVVAVGNAGGAAGMAYLDGLCGRRVTR